MLKLIVWFDTEINKLYFELKNTKLTRSTHILSVECMNDKWSESWFVFTQKGKTTVEILEGIEKDIDGLLRSKRRNVELEKHYMGSLLLYSVIGYLIMALFFYFLYNATTWLQRIVQILPLLLFPFL